MSHPHVFRYREYGPWPCSVRSVVSPYSGCSVHANLCQDPNLLSELCIGCLKKLGLWNSGHLIEQKLKKIYTSFLFVMQKILIAQPSLRYQ